MAAPESLPISDVMQKVGLPVDELEKVKQILGRQPNRMEMTILSAVWSKHITNVHVASLLKTLPSDSDRLVSGPGSENARLVAIGDGMACSFTVESHFVSPAVTSGTGMIRVSHHNAAMGTQPVAQFKVFHLGDRNAPGGAPTVGSTFFYDECYNANPLVSVFSAGIIEGGKAAKATPLSNGTLVFIVGGITTTSQDVTFESDADAVSADKRSVIQEVDSSQVADAMLEIGAHTKGIYPIGADGIIGSITEINAEGKHELSVILDPIAARQPGAEPSEILLSEFSEHWLIVVELEKEEAVKNLCHQRGLTCAPIGEVTASSSDGAGRVQVYYQGEAVADLPMYSLMQERKPLQNPPQGYQEPAYLADYAEFTIEDVDDLKLHEVKEVAEYLLKHPNVYSREWTYEQADSITETTDSSLDSLSDAAVIRMKEALTADTVLPNTETSLIITAAGNSRYVMANPRQGAMIAVVEAARNIVCSGGDPLAVTANLDFGEPHSSDVNWQLAETVQGVGEACRRFSLPVVGSNANFHPHGANDSALFPTPSIGMLGLMENPNYRMSLAFKNEGDRIYLIGPTTDDIAASEYLYSYRGIKAAPAPVFDVQTEWRVQEGIRTMIRNGWIRSAHGVSVGGLFTALIESAMAGGKGFAIESNERYRLDAFLFGEGQSRVVVSVPPEHFHHVEAYLDEGYNVFTRLGSVTAADFIVDETVIMTSAEARELYDSAPGKIREE